MPIYGHSSIDNQFLKHLSAMTGEQLHSKADIAAELAYRDTVIEHLEQCVRMMLIDLKAANSVACDAFDTEIWERALKQYPLEIHRVQGL